MKRAILYAALCLSGTALAQDTTYFKQDFEDLTLSIWADHYDKTINTENQALPHVKFNDLRGGEGGVGRRVHLETTSSGDRILKVKVEENEHYGRSISYYLGGRIVRGDPEVHQTHKGDTIYDSFVPDNDEMYFRYHIKLGSDWDFTNDGEIDIPQVVKIPGLSGTYNSGSGGMWPQDPDSLGWSARMLAGRDSGYPRNQWSPLSYVYHLNQKNNTGDHFPYFGEEDEEEGVNWNAAPRLQIDQWYRIEQRIKMNDPGQENGLTEVWINGEKDPDLCVYDLAYTTHDTIGINRAWADIHYGGRYSSPKNHHLFLDNFHVSTNPTPWSGELVGHSEWSGTILVTGDVTIPDGMDLTIAADTEIRFAANSDETGGGEDPARSELIVRGNLTTVGGGITFRSSNTTDPSHDDWYGIRVKSLGVARLTDVTVRDAKHCAQAETGGLLFSSGVTLTNCGTPPRVTGPAAPEFAEHGEGTVATYSATDAESDAVTWSLVDENDDDAFSIDSDEGVLSFQTPPNYEEPTAAGHAGDADLATRNVYRVTVLVEDGQGASTRVRGDGDGDRRGRGRHGEFVDDDALGGCFGDGDAGGPGCACNERAVDVAASFAGQ